MSEATIRGDGSSSQLGDRHDHRVLMMTWRTCGSALLAAVIAMIAAIPAGAQERPPATKSFAQVRLGSFTLTPALFVSEIGIDSNVLSVDDSTKTEPDFTATLRSELELRFRTDRANLGATAEAGFVYYHTHARERSVNPGVRLDAAYRFSSAFSAFAEGGVGFSRQRRGYEIDIRARQRNQDLRVGTRLTGRRVTFEAAAARTDTRYDRGVVYFNTPLDEMLNRKSDSLSFSLAYRLSPYTSLVAGADAIADRFAVSTVRDADSTRGWMGLRLDPRALIAGDIQLGYRVFKALRAEMPDFSGLTARGGLSYTFRDRISIGVGVERDVEYSYQPAYPYYVYLLSEAVARVALGSRFDVGVGAARTTMAYRKLSTVQAARPTDILRNISASLGLRVIRHSRVALYVSHWDRLSTVQPYRGLRVGLGITLGRLNLNERGVFMNGPGR